MNLDDVLSRLDRENLPFSPMIYPPMPAWGRIGDDSVVKRAWKRSLRLETPIALYIHVPFCKSLCSFCGLYAIRSRRPQELESYVKALRQEMGMLAPVFRGREISIVRIGGGTPSMLSRGQIAALLRTLRGGYAFKSDSQMCFEANPNSLDSAKLGVLKDNGVGWLALGVQSLDDEVIRRCGRSQTNSQVHEVYAQARKAGIAHIAIDLICGLDGQTEESFLNDVHVVAGWKPDRISIYEFTPTAATTFYRRGGVIPEDRKKLIHEMRGKGLAVLRSEGYRVGDSCDQYWGNLGEGMDEIWPYTYDKIRGDTYSIVGFGSGAISYACRGIRYQNAVRLEDYLDKLGRGRLPVQRGCRMNLDAEMRNSILLSLIDAGGIEDEQFRRSFGQDISKEFGGEFQGLIGRNVLERSEGGYRVVSERGKTLMECRKAFFEKKVAESLADRYREPPFVAGDRKMKGSVGHDLNLYIAGRCNQRCLFCISNSGPDVSDGPGSVLRGSRKGDLNLKGMTMEIEGGEPTLSKDLVKWVRSAKERGVADVVVSTNAAVFINKKIASNLLEAGVSAFDVNFPSHDERIFDLLTQTKGQFGRRVRAIKNLIEVAGGEKVRLTFVINSLNYLLLPQYVRFVQSQFPNSSRIEFKFIKVRGRVKTSPKLVPSLTQVGPRLGLAAECCRLGRTHFIVDEVPLCFMKGFETASADAFKLSRGGADSLQEQAQTGSCRGCSLSSICPGPRKDYVRIYGDKEMMPSSMDPTAVRDAFR